MEGSDREAPEHQSKGDHGNGHKKSEVKSWILSLAAAVAVALLLRFFVFEFIRVEGPSMQPTLYTDEFVFMEKLSYRFHAPERGDIVVCFFPDSTEAFIKRVIGLPGDRLKINDGTLYINGKPYREYFAGYIDRDMAETTVPEGSVFVMGDNRNESSDSREVGPIEYDKILGRAVFIIWPLDQIRGL